MNKRIIWLILLLVPATFLRCNCIYDTFCSGCNVDDSDNGTNSSTNWKLIPANTDLRKIVADPVRDRVYVADATENKILVISTKSRTITKSISVGTEPNGLAVDDEGAFLYVANAGDTTISVVDLDSLKVSTNIALPAAPWELVAGRQGRLYVALEQSWIEYGFFIIDTNQNKILKEVSLAGLPYLGDRSTLAISPDRNVLYVGWGGSPISMYRIDVLSDNPTLLKEIEHGVGSTMRDIVVSPDNSRLYFSCGAPYYVQVRDAVTFTELGRFETDAYPDAIVLSNDGTRCYASHQVDREILTFDTATFEQVARDSIPENCVDITLDRTNNSLFVLLENSGIAAIGQ